MNNNLQKLDSMPAGKAVLSNAIPAMLAMLMVLVYNMADLFFIGQTGDDLKVAAVSMATPVFLMFMALGNVFGIGGASILSRSLGSGNFGLIGKISSFCFWCCVALGTVLSLVVFLAMDSIVYALGSSADIAGMVGNYLRILSVSGPFILLSSCFSALMRAEGKPEKAMTGMMLGNIINIILDPIFIIVLGMGVEGAAIATVIGNVIGACYYLRYLLRADTMLSIRPSDFTCGDSVLKNVLIIGVPSSLSTILMGVSQMILNSEMSVYGDLAVAGIGVGMKVTMLTTMVCIGIGMGIQPLLGYAIGAQNEERYHKVFNFALLFAIAVSGCLTLLCYLGLEFIVGAFVSDPAAFEYAYFFAQVLISTSVVSAILFVLSNALQAAGAARASLSINISRQGYLFIPLLFIMGSAFGINGLVFAQPIADILAIIIATVLYKSASKKFFIK